MILVDGSNLLHRCLHVPSLRELKNSRGIVTGGIYGFLQTLSSLSSRRGLQEGILVCWDLGIPIFRREIFPGYKAIKSPVTGELPPVLRHHTVGDREEPGDNQRGGDGTVSQYTFSRSFLHEQLLPRIGCFSFQVPDCEADDLISFLAKVYSWEGQTSVIFSSDRDFFQLLKENKVEQIVPPDWEPTTEREFRDSLPLLDGKPVGAHWTIYWRLFRALSGDPSDGIDGIPGVGKKIAEEYALRLLRLLQEGVPLSGAVRGVSRPPRSRQSSHDFLVSDRGEERLLRNLSVMDLDLGFVDGLPLYHEISRTVSRVFSLGSRADLDECFETLGFIELDTEDMRLFCSTVLDANENGSSVPVSVKEHPFGTD